MHDYIIIGAGPSGLTLAYYLSNLNKKILLIDRESSIGGCHRVRRVNNLFTEHGPRIYTNNYKNFMTILQLMNTSFDKLFTPYNFDLGNIGSSVISNLHPSEILTLISSYLYFMLDNNPSKQITMLQYSNQHNFSQSTKDYIDRLCRLTDGAGIDRYTLYEFFELINQNALYTIYQPKLPNDKGLFKYWQESLIDNKVDIRLDTSLIKINMKENHIQSLTISNNNKMYDVSAKRYILAIAPKQLVDVLGNSSIDVRNIFIPFDSLKKWEKETEYLTYIPITFHWNTKLKLKKIWGFPSTEWGIASIILSEYMKFDNPLSQTVISVCITIPNAYSSYIKKTPNQCNQNELIDEVFRQLKELFPNLSMPTVSLLSPGVYYKDGKWHTQDSSFVFTKYGYLKQNNYKNLYNVGTYNGNSFYAFTSMESAVTNALYLLHELEPHTRQQIPILELFTINRFILIIIIILMIVYLIFFFR